MLPENETPPTLLEVAVGRLGIIKGPRVIADIVGWSLAMYVAGDDWPMVGEKGWQTRRVRLYRDTLGYSEPTAWRRLSFFREAFPGEVDPTRICDSIGLLATARPTPSEILQVGSVPVPV